MEITEVRIKLMEEDSAERLKAFCSITFDNAFVVRDLKIIEGGNGPFVAMPSRKLTAHCPSCNCKNHLRANHCNQCGRALGEARILKDEEGRAKLYADIAHPINSECRDAIQRRVVREYQLELERMKREGAAYVSRYDDPEFDARFSGEPAEPPRKSAAPPSRTTVPTKFDAGGPAPPPPHRREARRSTGRPGPHAAETRGESERASARPAAEKDDEAQGSHDADFGAGVFD